MKKFLEELKVDNQERYWGTLMKLNKDNQVFRLAFEGFLKETEEDYQTRISSQMKKRILAQRNAKSKL